MLYHVMSRGNAKQIIFTDDRDYERYLEVLERGLQRFDVRCLAYCLFGNHLHLLLRPNQFPISRLMQQVNSTYCQWFNRRHGRVGHVLQGRYRAVFVESPDSLFRVVRYILMNPVAAGRVAHPANWKWSSYRATAGIEQPARCADVASVWKSYNSVDPVDAQRRFTDHVAAGASADDVSGPQGFIVGSTTFVRQFEPLLQPYRQQDAFVLRERFAARPPLLELFSDVECPASSALAARRAFHEYAYTLREIGDHLKRPAGTVWCWIRRADRVTASGAPK
jgi:REP element-mobilizing transposase RayT